MPLNCLMRFSRACRQGFTSPKQFRPHTRVVLELDSRGGILIARLVGGFDCLVCHQCSTSTLWRSSGRPQRFPRTRRLRVGASARLPKKVGTLVLGEVRYRTFGVIEVIAVASVSTQDGGSNFKSGNGNFKKRMADPSVGYTRMSLEAVYPDRCWDRPAERRIWILLLQRAIGVPTCRTVSARGVFSQRHLVISP
jgi:hypothetical protein